MKQHKWAKEIKAWADGAEIECREKFTHGEFSSWWVVDNPEWQVNAITEYRIKPQPKEPKYLYVYRLHNSIETGFTLDKIQEAPYAKYIGKIKLEE
jgi:hypothetical protein